MRRALSSALIGGAAASAGGTIKLDWSDCGDSSTHGHITALSPTSVVLGAKTSLVGKGKVDEAIPGASYKLVAMETWGIPVFSHSGDACKPETIKLPAGAGEIDMKGFKCPMSAGDVELDLDLSLSSAIPAKLARITIELTAQSSTGDKVLCTKIKTSPESASEMLGLVATQDCEKEYQSFLKAYPNKVPSPEGYASFCANLEVIKTHNSANAAWSMGVNEFSDWTDDEKAVLLGWNVNDTITDVPAFESELSMELSTAVDWRSRMPAIKNQKSCGSCWAFSSIDVVDFFGGSHSEEELVDCYKGSCAGGDPRAAMQYLSRKGVASESAYPYTAGSGRAGQCHNFSPTARVSNVQGVSGASSIASALQRQVVSVCFRLQERGSPFMNYHRGVYDQQCGTGAGHCVAAVGYASDYWIIRNSWGSGWGQNGHIYFKKGSNLCGMEDHGTIASVSSSSEDAALVVV
jgi:C1A family cysteine protease